MYSIIYHAYFAKLLVQLCLHHDNMHITKKDRNKDKNF